MIVPTYKQARTINRDLRNIDKVLKSSLDGVKYEIICVVDGEVDRTYKEAKKIREALFSAYQKLGFLPEFYAVTNDGKLTIDDLETPPVTIQAWSVGTMINFLTRK